MRESTHRMPQRSVVTGIHVGAIVCLLSMYTSFSPSYNPHHGPMRWGLPFTIVYEEGSDSLKNMGSRSCCLGLNSSFLVYYICAFGHVSSQVKNKQKRMADYLIGLLRRVQEKCVPNAGPRNSRTSVNVTCY